MHKLVQVGLAVSVVAAPVFLASPAWAWGKSGAGNGTVNVTASGSGSSASLSATIKSIGNGGGSGGGTGGSSGTPGSSTPGSEKITKTYPGPPHGCTAHWYSAGSALGQALGGATLTATCTGNGAAQNLQYYGLPTPTCNVIKGTNYCSIDVTWTPGKNIPPKKSTPALKKNPYSGIPSELLAVFDSLTVPTPKIAGMVPSPTTPGPQGQPPYLYTRLPTQVAVVPSSTPPTLTSSHTTNSTSTVNTTWNAKLNKWNTKQVTTTLTASITATFAGVLWVPEAADVNGSLNIATPSGEIGPTTGVIMCNPDQNNLSYHLNNDLPNPNFCFIDFVQPSNLSGYYVHAYAAYTASGTITENGAKIWSGFLGEKYSAVPASQQVVVAVIESVGCSTQKCKNAGLAPNHQVISPLPEYTPGG